MSKEIVWSYSTISAFELCPKKYWHEKIKRDVKDKKSHVASYGDEAHKKFEQRLIKNKPLPLDLRHHEKTLQKIYNAPGEGMPEQRIAVDKNFNPTGFFDDDVWCRGVVDYAKVNEVNLLIADWKFGKMRDNFDQLDLMTALMFCLLPEIEKATSMFYWAKNKKVTYKKYTRHMTSDIWNDFLPRVNRMEEAHQHDEFPAKPNGLCKKYCGVTSCPYHGE